LYDVRQQRKKCDQGGQLKLLDLELDVYQGPFDLLFTLILKEEVDVCEVRLTDIIVAYLDALLETGRTDWDGLSEFLVLISSLLELKSRLLLPGQVPAEDELDPATAAELLIERLLRYQMFKGASLGLQERLVENQGRLLRPADPPLRQTPVELPAASQDPRILATAVSRLAQARQGPDASHISPARIDLRRQIAHIRRMVVSQGRFSFEERFGREEPMTQAISLFALLELVAEGSIRTSQSRPFADITVMRREGRRVA
jgi:segregation and condensation protein A